MMKSEESTRDGSSGSSNKGIREINILSFDGGGSKGMMEAFILKDVFNFLTILQRDSDKLEFLLDQETDLDTKEGRGKLRRLLDSCDNPIHPTEAFDFIVGTSVGSLIAFGLVGGKKIGQERTPMQVEEIFQMFKDCTETMFDKKADTGWISWMTGKVKGLFLPFPAIPYSQDGLEKTLSERFGDLYLGGFPRPNGCVAGAVAKRIFRETGVAGNEVLFTTKGLNDMYKVVDVLKASSAAPIYFETPAMIGDEAYIDGGDGGNCPLAQALEAIPEIFGEQVKVMSVLSIAPPRSVIGPIPEENQWMYWLNYFPSQVTDGAAVYHHVSRSHRRINCQRLFPKSEGAKKFKLDEMNVAAMISCMETESIEDKSYFTDIIQAAFRINLRLQESKNDVRLKLCNHLFKSTPKLEFAHLCLDMAEHDGASSFEIARIKEQLGDCYFHHDQYDKAMAYYKESLDASGEMLEPEDLANLNNRVGFCLKRKACYNEAREYFQKTELMFQEHKVSPFVVAETYYNLGDCDLHMENVGEAINSYMKSLECGIREVPEELNATAFSYNESPEIRESEVLDARIPFSDDGRPETREEVSNVTAFSYNGLGNCYLKQENFKAAEEYYVKSLEEKKDARSIRDKKYKAKLLNDAAVCRLMTGKHDHAISSLEESLEIQREIFGIRGKSLTIAGSHANLGNCYMKKRDYDKAIDFYRMSHQMNAQIFGEDSAIPCMAETYNNLGVCFLNKQEKSIDEALSFFKSSLNIKRRVYGEDKPKKSIAITYNNLGKTMMEKSEYDKAVDYYKTSLQIKKEIYGDDPSIVSITIAYQNLGHCYQTMGDEQNATSCFKKIENKKVDAEELLEGDFLL